MLHRSFVLLAAVLAALSIFASTGSAKGGDYAIVGGTPFEQAQVRAALDVSSFDWSLVPVPVTIRILRGSSSYSSRSLITLDANVLDTGRFSWGVVQMEYAQQVHMFLLTDAMRAALVPLLGAQQWCYDNAYLPPGANACERFAATLAWTYWPVYDNCMQPSGRGDWSASMDPASFRALVSRLLGGAWSEQAQPLSANDGFRPPVRAQLLKRS